MEATLTDKGIENAEEKFDAVYTKLTGYRAGDHSAVRYAPAVKVPTMVVQVHDDAVTKPWDAEQIHDAIPVKDKKLFWIEGTPVRYEGYRYFSQNPEQMLAWYDAHMKA